MCGKNDDFKVVLGSMTIGKLSEAYCAAEGLHWH